MKSSQKLKQSGLLSLVGNTPLVKVQSLSALTGTEIFMKCETFNPGGTVKDRPALTMVIEAIESGILKPGMTIVEGTAGNTGIGLAMVGQSLGFKVIVVMPKGQDTSKHRLLKMYGAQIEETEAVAYTDDRHFFKVGRKIGTSSPDFWWANQFDNLANFKSHFQGTGPEIFHQMNGDIDYFTAAAGTGGTLAGVSSYLKMMNPKVKISLVDPVGSGLVDFVKLGKFPEDIPYTYTMIEGVGITRLVENFKKAQVDHAFTISDQLVTSLAYYLREKEGLVMGMSSMLNLAGTLIQSLQAPKGSRLVTLMCDGGDRALSKMYNDDFIQEKKLDKSVLSDNELRSLFASQKI